MVEIDRRIRRTRKLLKEALVEVTLEKGYQNVTIQDVTERADIGYRTFFRHFSGIDDLLVAVGQETLDELRETLIFPTKIDASLVDGAHKKNGQVLFTFIQGTPQIFQVLFLERGVRFCLQPVFEAASKDIDQLLSTISDLKFPQEIIANHIIASIFELIRWWLLNDMPHSPEVMGEIM
ncbi:MAG: TetR/AcrR family transcriptional regulator, partial [Chloroflexota bacterium]